jgi:hypothetical protein
MNKGKDSLVVVKTIVQDSVWMFRSFGFMAGVRFLVNTTIRNLRLLWKKEEPTRFKDLSDEDAQACAWAFGIHTWTDRADLNRQWNKFELSLKDRY